MCLLKNILTINDDVQLNWDVFMAYQFARINLIFKCLSQFKGDHIRVPGTQHLRPGSDQWLVRLAGRVPSLERQEETETPGRAFRSHSFQFERYPQLVGTFRSSIRYVAPDRHSLGISLSNYRHICDSQCFTRFIN